MPLGNLIVITAPSGAGKTSLVRELLAQDSSLVFSVSFTTRPRRSEEVEGISYHFISKDEFLGRLAAGEFLESAQVYGHHYGTSQRWVNEQLEAGKNVILELDWQGAAQVRNLQPNACFIFILPPSLDSLTQRLTERAQDDQDTIDGRMRQARGVIEHVAEADYVVVNDDFDTALRDILAIVRASGLRVKNQERNLAELMTSLTRPTVD